MAVLGCYCSHMACSGMIISLMYTIARHASSLLYCVRLCLLLANADYAMLYQVMCSIYSIVLSARV